jgi:exosortase
MSNIFLKNDEKAKVLSNKAIVYAIPITVFLAFIYWPTLRWLVNSWLSSDYYSHGFLVPLVSAVIIWIKRNTFKTTSLSIYGTIWLLLGIGLYVANLILEIRVCGPLSLLSVITGLIWLFWGRRTVQALVFPLAFLLFLIPFPFVPTLAYHLQVFSIFASTHLLGVFGLPIISTGGEIYLKDLVFSVGLPCSGIDSLIALLALASVYCFVLKGVFLRRIGLVVLAIPIAIGANILRIMSIIMLAYFYDFETAIGWFHDIASPVFFLLAFLVIVLVGWILKLRISYGIFRRIDKNP